MTGQLGQYGSRTAGGLRASPRVLVHVVIQQPATTHVQQNVLAKVEESSMCSDGWVCVNPPGSPPQLCGYYN